VRPEGDKATRMAAASSKFDLVKLSCPERAHWLAESEAELFAFPGSPHDDQCDSISQALLDGNRGLCLDDQDHWDKLLEAARLPTRWSRR
jgi:phage terminase large subunit-like protein